MEKQTLIAICAALALTGQIQASAPLVNAVGRLALNTAILGGGTLYAAENYPTAFGRVSYLIKGPESSTPAVTSVPDSTQLAGLEKLVMANQTAQIQQSQVLQAQMASMSQASNGIGKQVIVNLASNPLVIGLVVIGGYIVYKRFDGTRYTQRLIKKAEKKAKHFREWTSERLSEIWDSLSGIEDKVDTNAKGLSLIASALATLNNGNIDKNKGAALAQFVRNNQQPAPGQAEGAQQQEKENFPPYVEPAEPEPEQDENSFSVSGATATCMNATATCLSWGASALSWGASWFK